MEMKELLDGLAARAGVAGGFTPDEEGVQPLIPEFVSRRG